MLAIRLLIRHEFEACNRYTTAPLVINQAQLDSSLATLGLGFCLVLVFLAILRLIRCNCGDESLYSDPGPPFLISSTVSISPLELSS